LDKCAYSGDFVSEEALSTDGQGNCVLGPFSIHPVATVDDEDCKGNYPELDVKIIAVNKDELRIYFSRDGGKTYYNEDDPRLAIMIPAEHDADGMNSGGSSSKGGKKGTNDRRRLVEAAKAQLQRKLQCEKKCFGDRAELRSAVDMYIKYECQYWWNKALCDNLFVKELKYGFSHYGYPMNDWCVDHVTDMSYLFSGKYQFNEDISNWKTGQVTTMKGMFLEAYEFNRDLSRWDVSKVTNMHGMFYFAKKFNQDISMWDVSQVTDMSSMFYKAYAFNQDISSWDVSKVTNMNAMFSDAHAFNQDISSWDISQVTDMSYMFDYAYAGAGSFNQDLCKWANKFPYNKALDIFWNTKCKYKSEPVRENGGPFCASDCKS
jgi:surface protein